MPLFVEWMRRKPGTSNEEFTAYWRDHHAPIVRDRAEVKAALAAQKYTHYRTLPDDPLTAEMLQARGFGTAPYDGICIPESAAVSINDYAAALADPSSDTIGAWTTLLTDEVNFMDMATSIPCFATEEALLNEPGAAPSTHVMICYRRAKDVSSETFLDFRRNAVADHVAKLSDDLDLVGYRRIVPIDTPLNEQFCSLRGCVDCPFDAMDVASFHSRSSLANSWQAAREAWDELIAADDSLIDVVGSTLVIADSVVIFDDQTGGRSTR